MGLWTTDGAKGFSIEENVVKLASNGGLNNVFNAMWREGNGVSSGQHYWKIHFPHLQSQVGKGRTGVGFTSDKHFGASYACKSINYSGDLNVSGMNDAERGRVVLDFGPKLKKGDTVGMLAIFENDRLRVFFVLNDTNLGLAFDVSASNFESIFPMVSFDYEGSATCTKSSVIPLHITSRSADVFPGIVGTWKLAKYDGQMIPQPVAPHCLLLKTGTDKYQWHVNRIRTDVVNENGIWKSTSNIFIPGRKSSKQEKLERDKKIIDLMTTVNKIETDGINLSIRSDRISSLWSRPRISVFVGGDIFKQSAPLSSGSIASSGSAASTDTASTSSSSK